MRLPEQQAWLVRKGALHGFAATKVAAWDADKPSSRQYDFGVSQEQMLNGRQHAGNGIRIYSVLYDGILTVTDPTTFVESIRSGIGHGKALGLGMLSLASVA
jgi:CRISPR system Cascade subunit CasE